MSLKPLTDLSIKRLAIPEKGQKVHYEPSGLGVRVSQGGTKSFVVQLGSNRRRKTLGRYPQMSLKAARIEAMRVINDADRYATTRSAESAITDFIEVCRRKNKSRTVADYHRTLTKHFPKIDLGNADRMCLQNKLRALTKTPAEQFHATVVFRTFLNWCVNVGYLDMNPLVGVRNMGKLNNRDRVLSDAELKAVWNSLPDDRFGALVRLLILTGQRKSEVTHLSIECDVATLPSQFAKNSREHKFPVGPLTLEYFREADWNGWSKSKARLDRESGVTGWTFHDLRRTFATNHARLGTPIHVIEKILNHVSGTISGVAAIYNRYSYMDEMRDACTKYEDWLRQMISD